MDFVFAAHEANLAFIVLADDPQVFCRVFAATTAYCGINRVVQLSVLKGEPV